MKASFFDTNKTNTYSVKDLFMSNNNGPDKKIDEETTAEEIADIVSDNLIALTKQQLEKAKEKFNEQKEK